MKTMIKHLRISLSISVICLVSNYSVQAETKIAVSSCIADSWSKKSVMAVAKKVADWQISDFPRNKYAVKEPKGWISGAFYMGLMDWAELCGDSIYFSWLRNNLGLQNWQVADRLYHADDVCVAQTYIDLYNKYKDKRMLDPILARTEWVINNPSNGSMDLDYSDEVP